VSLDFETNFEMVESRNIDLVFTNPSLFTCLEAEYGAAAAASLLFQRTVGFLKRYSAYRTATLVV
jgi:hypothetical protein